MKDLIKAIGALAVILFAYTPFFESFFLKRSPQSLEAVRAKPGVLKQIRLILLAAAIVYVVAVSISLFIH